MGKMEIISLLCSEDNDMCHGCLIVISMICHAVLRDGGGSLLLQVIIFSYNFSSIVAVVYRSYDLIFRSLYNGGHHPIVECS